MMLKILLRVFCVAMLTAFCVAKFTALAPTGSYEEGATHYNRGDFSAARRSWVPLEKSDPVVQYFLGVMHQHGQGLPVNHSIAANWYQKAADQGYPRAQASLAYLYLLGLGVKENIPLAVRLLKTAADKGDVQAQRRLCALFQVGKGPISPDFTEATKWARLAADQGDLISQFNLGLLLFYGTGVPKDRTEGIKWCRKAAIEGYIPALYQLALMHDDLGDRAKLINAWGWYRLAADEGHAAAKERLQSLERILTKDEIRVGEAQARDFRKKMRRPEAFVSR